MQRWLKRTLCGATVALGADRLFRYLNRSRLLVVMYHGVTERAFDPPIWTQLPVDIFERQILFLRKHYRMVSLAEVVAAIRSGAPLPERAALITFDDGMKNNYSVAFPVLQRLGVPAGIFLTVNLIGTDQILWFDELYLLIAAGRRSVLPLMLLFGADAERHYEEGRLWEAYLCCVEALKRGGMRRRGELMEVLRRTVRIDLNQYLPDLGLLDWEEVRDMKRTGLVDFGVHTATHRILSELDDSGMEAETVVPRRRFEEELGYEPEAFCFPNGHAGVDFNETHQDYLAKCGYLCAFTTDSALFDWSAGNRLGIGRIPAGNDCTSAPEIFRLNTSGIMAHLLPLLRRGAT